MLWEREPQASVSTALSSSVFHRDIETFKPISVRICFGLFSKTIYERQELPN